VPDPASVGVISNPASRHNARGGLRAVDTALAAQPRVRHCLARSPPEIEAGLREFAAAGVRCVVLNGGDGTVQAALTTLALRSPFAEPPRLLVLAGGTTNMSAYDLGSHGKPAALLGALLAGRLTTTRRRVLGVREADGTTRCGFFLTAGGLPQAVRECRAFRERSRLPGLGGALGTAAWIAGRLARLPVGRAPFAPLPLTLQTGDAPAVTREAFLLLATTLQHLAFGIRPWWSSAGGAIHVTTISRPARWLGLALPGLLRGRPPAFANSAAGYESRSTDAFTLTPGGGYALDGEDYFPPAGSALTVRSGPQFEFLCP
jgi:diacylglycerol kinase family enzyme